MMPSPPSGLDEPRQDMVVIDLGMLYDEWRTSSGEVYKTR